MVVTGNSTATVSGVASIVRDQLEVSVMFLRQNGASLFSISSRGRTE